MRRRCNHVVVSQCRYMEVIQWEINLCLADTRNSRMGYAQSTETKTLYGYKRKRAMTLLCFNSLSRGANCGCYKFRIRWKKMADEEILLLKIAKLPDLGRALLITRAATDPTNRTIKCDLKAFVIV